MSILKSTHAGKYSEPITILYLMDDLHLYPINYGKTELGEMGVWSIDRNRFSHESAIQLYKGIWTFTYRADAPKNLILKRLYCKSDVDMIYDFWTTTDELTRFKKLANIIKTLENYSD